MPPQSTINQAEAAKFAAMADEWWDEEGQFKPLHQLNPTRIAFIRAQLTKHFDLPAQSRVPLQGLTILDVGCGGGLLSVPLARLGAQLTGIDVVPENIAAAQHYCQLQQLDNATFQQISVEELAPHQRQFDAVVCMEVLEHVDNLPLFMQSICQLVRPEGMLIIATINRTLKSLALAKIAAEYILRMVPTGTHDWRKFLPPEEVFTHLNRHQYSISGTYGLQFNILTNTWFIGSDLSMNYIIVATC
jgi:2-polyprenyl-6-hydroxyphenyl methylase / 3-demethylubiquinone-9 3-methyltransferase